VSDITHAIIILLSGLKAFPLINPNTLGKKVQGLTVKRVLSDFILLNDFTCRETRLHNADWFNRLIALGSIQRYAVYQRPLTGVPHF
jgi:hypothetical protein